MTRSVVCMMSFEFGSETCKPASVLRCLIHSCYTDSEDRSARKNQRLSSLTRGPGNSHAYDLQNQTFVDKYTTKPPPTAVTTCTTPHANRKHARKSWRSDVPVILPGWEHHTGGSRSTSNSTPVPGLPRRLWVAHSITTITDTTSAPTNEPNTLHAIKHSRKKSKLAFEGF